MRFLIIIALLLITSQVCNYENIGAADDKCRLEAAVSPDSILALTATLPVKLRTQIAKPKSKRPYYIFHGCGDLGRFWECAIDYSAGEGVFYATCPGGRYYPLFPVERFPISDEAWEIMTFTVDDPGDELLGYGGRNIFDDVEKRRHDSDSLLLKRLIYHVTIKK